MKYIWKIHKGWPSREMIRAEGWVMVRRKGCLPYIISEKEWDDLKKWDIEK